MNLSPWSSSLDHGLLFIGRGFADARKHFRHVDALEAKVRELEQATCDTRTRTLNEYSPVPSQTERSHDVSETTQYSLAGPRPPQSARNFDSGRSSIAAKDSTLSSPSSPPSRESRKLYNKSSSLHFALNVKASAKAMAPGSNLEPDGSKRLSTSSFPPDWS